MIKNGIISSLLVYEFSKIPYGWAVQGISKTILCVVLAILLTAIITEFEVLLKGGKKYEAN